MHEKLEKNGQNNDGGNDNNWLLGEINFLTDRTDVAATFFFLNGERKIKQSIQIYLKWRSRCSALISLLLRSQSAEKGDRIIVACLRILTSAKKKSTLLQL